MRILKQRAHSKKRLESFIAIYWLLVYPGSSGVKGIDLDQYLVAFWFREPTKAI